MDDSAKQVGALPVRRRDDGSLQVMLVTSRKTRRWVIPKGWPWPNTPDPDAAAGEAREEAGVIGQMSAETIGSYRYEKRRPVGAVPVRVAVYLVEVSQELDRWPEQDRRRRAWFSVAEAAAAVEEPELKALIQRLPELV